MIYHIASHHDSGDPVFRLQKTQPSTNVPITTVPRHLHHLDKELTRPVPLSLSFNIRLLRDSFVPIAIVPLRSVGKEPVKDDSADGENEDKHTP